LEAHPDEVRRLADYLAAEPAIERMMGEILPLTTDVMRSSLWARSRHGLLINDSLTAAMMRGEGIVNLASNDAAFLRLDGFTVFRPTDLQ
jgi:predicted nucleic acid-binding protein